MFKTVIGGCQTVISCCMPRKIIRLLSCSMLLKAGPLNILRPGLGEAFYYTLGLLLHGNLDIGPRKKKSWPRALEKKRRALPRKKNMGAAKKLCSWLLRGTLHILIVFNTFTFEVLWCIISKIYRHRKTTAICLTAIVSELCCCRLCWYDKVVRSSG